MLDVAVKYESELQELFANIMFDEKYKYYYNYSFRNKYQARESTWEKHEFVSLSNQKVIGYLAYNIDRDSMCISGLEIINFTEEINLVFAKDLKVFLKDIFEKFNFRKINFSVVKGNPIEKSYDKMINKFGGRIIGIQKEEVKLFDNKYYDLKLYEILRNDYLLKKR